MVNGTVTFACNGNGAHPPLSEKSMSLSNVDVYNSPPSPSDQPLSPFLSNGHQKHHWRHSPMRTSSFLPNGMIPRQQTTIDESITVNEDGQEASISADSVDQTLKPNENGVGLLPF